MEGLTCGSERLRRGGARPTGHRFAPGPSLSVADTRRAMGFSWARRAGSLTDSDPEHTVSKLLGISPTTWRQGDALRATRHGVAAQGCSFGRWLVLARASVHTMKGHGTHETGGSS